MRSCHGGVSLHPPSPPTRHCRVNGLYRTRRWVRQDEHLPLERRSRIPSVDELARISSLHDEPLARSGIGLDSLITKSSPEAGPPLLEVLCIKRANDGTRVHVRVT